VFENIIEQGAVLQLKNDILCGKYAPSMLFYGPPESGKGSAALELARKKAASGNVPARHANGTVICSTTIF